MNDKDLSERMRTPIDGPLVAPTMTISQGWYEARVEEVYRLECRIRGLEFVRDKKQEKIDSLAEAKEK